jgi:peptidoglycan LD-endopeptidase CwlK
MDKRSQNNMMFLQPELQRLYNAVDKKMPIIVTDTRRGKAAQEKAFASGRSKVHFGESAHNYQPAVAADVYPKPYNPNNLAAIEKLDIIIYKTAKELNIPIRQGVDFDMDGNWHNDDFKDRPHTELHPWRDWAKKSKLYFG